MALQFRDNSGSPLGRSPRLQRRVGSLTADDVYSITVSNYDHEVEERDERDSSWLRRFVESESCFYIFLTCTTSPVSWHCREFRMRDQAENGRVADMEDGEKGKANEDSPTAETEEFKFKRENRKSTKSNKSLTLPLDPNRRKVPNLIHS